MINIGIDFSLNSPGMCIRDENGEIKFVSFYNDEGRDPDKPILKAHAHHHRYHEEGIIESYPYDRGKKSKDFLIRERQKIEDAALIADLIIEYITENYSYDDINIGLEGFSYGSKGNSFIDMVQYNSFLRRTLYDHLGKDSIFVFQPSHVKKNAGKGNANKHKMVEYFQDDVFNDSELRKTGFWKDLKGKDYSKKIPKPIDDLVDSYFIMKSLLMYKDIKKST